MPLAAGTRLGAYEITGPIGAGGMGEVYRAEDARLRRAVAIKILPPHLATADRLERFQHEARAASTLNHPNILTIHDVGRDGDTAWIAMELVEGQSLRQILAAGPMRLRRAIDLARQVAEGLAKAHAAGIVHRDLKPENVMVTSDGLAKIVDFGIAKVGAGAASVAAADATVTATAGTTPGVVVGTLGYMSPEQASARPVDYRADQFALGLLIYELVTGARPFERPTTAQSLAATIEADPVPIDALNPNVPPHLSDIVTRLLAKEPAERYDSTRDLARDLASVLDGLSRRTPTAGITSAGTIASNHPSRSRWVRPAVVAMLVLAAAAASAWLVRRGADRPPQAIVAEVDRPLIAVRSFRNLSAEPQQAYFAAGMTAEIRGQLSQISALRVLGATGLQDYGDDLSRAARELGLRSFVDGSVRVEGNRVRVSAELVDAATRESRWSQQYDRELAGVLAVQSDIAQQIARALDPNLSEAQRTRLARQPTDNLEAYTLYLRTRELPSFNRAQNLEAVDLLKKAVALDPEFAEAQSNVAYRLVFMGYYDDPSWIDKGIAEAEAALRIDPDLPSAHFTLGTAYAMKGQGARSRQAFLRALELNPSGGGLLSNFSIAEMLYGRLDEAVYLGRRGFDLSGKRAFYHLVLPILTIRADAETRILLEEAERRAPREARIQMLLAMLDVHEGKLDAAGTRSRAVAEREPGNLEMAFHRADIAFLADAPDLESLLAPLVDQSPTNRLWGGESVRLRYAYALQKRGESTRSKILAAEAERYARERIASGDDSPVQRVELAAAAALGGDADEVFEWLERAFEAGFRDYGFLEYDPIFGPLGGDARFIRVVDQMRRDVAEQRERARTRGLLELPSLIGKRLQAQ